MAETIRVEVAFALPDEQALVAIEVSEGSTVHEAIDQSGIAARFAGVDLDGLPVGIWGREVGRDHELSAGDRVEIYRALETEPREARRQQAKS